MSKGGRINRFVAFAIGLALALQVNTAHAQFMCGDVNDDGRINIADLTYTLSYLYDSGPPPTDFQAADVDRQKYLTIIDVVTLIQCVFSCEHFGLYTETASEQSRLGGLRIHIAT